MVFSKLSGSLCPFFNLNIPSKLYINLEGAPHSIFASKFIKSISSIFCVISGAFLNFQSVSPSN